MASEDFLSGDLLSRLPPAGAPISFFEFWPGWLFYTPIVLYWIAMGLRHGDLSLPTAANPRIETGGLCGESKSGILDMAGPLARRWIAPYATFMSGNAEAAFAAMTEAGLSFPVVIKPDIGCNGTGVKKVDDATSLRSVVESFPSHTRLLVQELIDMPVEGGIFWMREPGQPRGRISSITYKEVPTLIGDGVATIEDLVRRDRRTGRIPDLYLPRLKRRLHESPAAGERVPLVFAGNHCKGSIFHDGRRDVTDALSRRLDDILSDVPEFHFGRIDLKARSVSALRKGEDFRIIEINGVGSEATHIWDGHTTLYEAYRAQFEHYGAAFRIAAANRARGWKSAGAWSLLRAWRRQKRLMRAYPLND
ncbi:D-alanine--D-alanine ligase [Acidomonas methanolica]|nr:D-alanine--D-alanine ligase [Acidomonas methanolica]MBU2653200.1 D-alanine--D-alanine ligase [Acidomonas methanolica]